METDTHTQTHKPSTVTLAAHACRGLMKIVGVGGLAMEGGEIPGHPPLYETLQTITATCVCEHVNPEGFL